MFDGTNGIYVNRRTRIRDQERSPIAADLKRLMREKSRRGRRTMTLTLDVAEAHRHVPIHPRDGHMLRLQVTPGEALYVHTVGTFGVATASHCWSRERWGMSRSTVLEAKRTRGTCLWRTTSTSRQEVQSIAPHSSSSLLFVSSPGPSFLAKDSRRRRGDLGWFRVTPELVPARDLPAPRRLVL